MAVDAGDHIDSLDIGKSFTSGMEQFHHPRRVRADRSDGAAPTPQRRQLVVGLSGRVLEIGAGDGVTLSCYPAAVEEIVLVEPDPFLRAAAKGIAKRIPTSVRVLDGNLRYLPVPDGSCHAVVCSLVLCCAAGVQETLREVRRVLVPGGELRFYEHQRSDNPMVTLVESLLTPLWSRVAGGCHPARNTVAAIQQAGFVIESLDRFRFRHFDHVLGVATSSAA